MLGGKYLNLKLFSEKKNALTSISSENNIQKNNKTHFENMGTNDNINQDQRKIYSRDKRIIHEGWLNKWTNIIGNYRPRYFVLENGILRYSIDKYLPTKETFVLSHCKIRVCPGDPLHFEIDTIEQGILYLKANFPEDKHKWYISFKRAQLNYSQGSYAHNKKQNYTHLNNLNASTNSEFLKNIIKNTNEYMKKQSISYVLKNNEYTNSPNLALRNEKVKKTQSATGILGTTNEEVINDTISDKSNRNDVNFCEDKIETKGQLIQEHASDICIPNYEIQEIKIDKEKENIGGKIRNKMKNKIKNIEELFINSTDFEDKNPTLCLMENIVTLREIIRDLIEYSEYDKAKLILNKIKSENNLKVNDDDISILLYKLYSSIEYIDIVVEKYINCSEILLKEENMQSKVMNKSLKLLAKENYFLEKSKDIQKNINNSKEKEEKKKIQTLFFGNNQETEDEIEQSDDKDLFFDCDDDDSYNGEENGIINTYMQTTICKHDNNNNNSNSSSNNSNNDSNNDNGNSNNNSNNDNDIADSSVNLENTNMEKIAIEDNQIYENIKNHKENGDNEEKKETICYGNRKSINRIEIEKEIPIQHDNDKNKQFEAKNKDKLISKIEECYSIDKCENNKMKNCMSSSDGESDDTNMLINMCNRKNKKSLNFRNIDIYTDKSIKRRIKLPSPRTDIKISMWSLLKDCIGKDLSRIGMPIYLNEPSSFLQRLAEDFQYIYLLKHASNQIESTSRLAFVAAFTISPYASVIGRTFKPFNPLLGETYELTHRNFYFLSEQVVHHPPITAYHCHNEYMENFASIIVNVQILGKSVEVITPGYSHLLLRFKKNNLGSTSDVATTKSSSLTDNKIIDKTSGKKTNQHINIDKKNNNYYYENKQIDSKTIRKKESSNNLFPVDIEENQNENTFNFNIHNNNKEVAKEKNEKIEKYETEHYTYQRANMIIHNIIFGKIWVELYGNILIRNHNNGDFSIVSYLKKGWFDNEIHKIRGIVCDRFKNVIFFIYGKWSQEIYIAYVKNLKKENYDTCFFNEDGTENSHYFNRNNLNEFINNFDWKFYEDNINNLNAICVWKAQEKPKNNELYYGFNNMTMELNEISPEYDRSKGASIACTDSRFRPDQRNYENGNIEIAMNEKHRLENKQRINAKKFTKNNPYKPKWFTKNKDPIYKDKEIYLFNNTYWETKKNRKFPDTPDIF
ncbi:oxysterol-binding protein, putative [Plasmodium berghei]|uniref:Oxysterol-binding protein, putative n=2 Tax=Plasmodium berghei TaxID=5821 RepID=A0A509APT9_PLABA|nr:oxysterol-binding protein, putative [Plasmodium berghei ANKA]CXI42093.1 oxysterol-binding protein, putative [Plasmodium berghei]SCM22040.1 oxysterol-binding protein, putative [Plasmodium berghei]SCN25241.1 oxysterol-binding protein, putative [Plasmodium berghei]SCO60229.1 oxysterol-binding protein, putative [Plasmodium berghei]SCO61867.1 oxysterol-binding protein, putative [Plasmodium berghei]|eukprot:XP_034421517.1 oxysterol-binding protein, putative [Plasmodium berghei ANKA]